MIWHLSVRDKHLPSGDNNHHIDTVLRGGYDLDWVH